MVRADLQLSSSPGLYIVEADEHVREVEPEEGAGTPKTGGVGRHTHTLTHRAKEGCPGPALHLPQSRHLPDNVHVVLLEERLRRNMDLIVGASLGVPSDGGAHDDN